MHVMIIFPANRREICYSSQAFLKPLFLITGAACESLCDTGLE